MAIGTTYTIDDPIPDSSYPLFAMESVVSYGYQEGRAASMQPAVPPPFSSGDEEKSELSTEYKSNPMLVVTFKRQPYTTSQLKNLRLHKKIFPLCDNPKVSNYTLALAQQADSAYKSRSTDPPALRKPQNTALQRGFSAFRSNTIVSNVRLRHLLDVLTYD